MSSSREEYIGDNSENNYIDEVDLIIDDGDTRYRRRIL